MANIKSMFAKMANDTDSAPMTNGRTDMSNGGGDVAELAASKSAKTKPTIETVYQKKSQLEHILLRPDTYIGSVEKSSEFMWVYDPDTKMIVQKQIEYVPGLYKIFDEILVNAADHKQRSDTMDYIKIDINPETNTISIRNNGKGIPVTMHKEEKMYVPTMIFGHLLTSSNYNDEEEKVTGGRNGYGAKLCNIFSTKFTVETASKEYKRQFKQTWGSNMTKASEPKVKDFTGEEYTLITFSPDLAKFKMDRLDEDIVGLMSRRAYDVAASTRGAVKIFLNGTRIPVKNFKDYVDLFIKGKTDDCGQDLKVIYETVSDRWEVALTQSSAGFQQMSFVNSIATTRGGRHVDYVADMVAKHLIEILKKKNKGGAAIKQFQIKNHMWLFINCLIVNPSFSSQTKENLTLQPKNFGSKCNLSEKFFTSVVKSGIVESVLSWAKFKAQTQLNKHSGKKQAKIQGIPKLDDANKAGTKDALRCTLILTEGDSAKTLAVAGLGVIGRDYYGVFPLKGKLLNVREATPKQIIENQEIDYLIKIIGLQYKKKYNTDEDMKTLRYGKVMIMTDQDQDGSHIKGLLINFLHCKWPELLRRNFLEEFITPIVKAKKKNQELSFFSLPEFEEWKANTQNHHTYQIKYYKGLGTSTSKEAKEYFSNMDRHRIRFSYNGQQDDDHIVLAFSKKHIEHRKEWLTNFMVESKRRKELGMPDKYLYTKNTKTVSYTEFVNLELVLFSNADNIRSIPSIVDGFKPGQRKVLFTCFKRNDKREVKVAQLAGSVAEMSAYHHGEVSLAMTIVNLAQNFVGSNNINILQPIGQFGTRMSGGKDSASPRYIFTKLSPLARMLYPQSDDPLLKHEFEDSQKIEPVWYVPIIPMVLVNGADGIGTGWMTKIPNFNPRELAQNMRLMMEEKETKPISPWYKNFGGTIENCGDQRFVVSGEISIIGDNEIEITELPVGTWTQHYKEHVLEPLMNKSEKVKAIIEDYKDYSTDTTVKFVVSFLPGEMENAQNEGFHKVFKLQTMISMSSMCVFDELGCLRRMDNVEEIMQEFYTLRLKFYQKRKDYLEGMLHAEAERLSHQARFIVEKCDRTLVVENKKRKVIVDELIKRGYPADPVKTWKARSKLDDDEEEAAPPEEEEEVAETKTDAKKPEDPEKEFKNSSDVQKFDYLLGMSMWMLTEEKKNEMLRQRDNKLQELDILKNKSKTDLWREDLDAFLEKIDEVEEKEKREEAGKPTKKEKGVGRKKPAIQETMPSPMGKRVAPTITDDIKRKVQNAAKAKKKGVKKEIITDKEEKDEFDVLVQSKKTLKDKIGTPEEAEKKGRKKKATDGLKQTKLNFKKKSPEEKKVNGTPKKRGRKPMFGDDNSESDGSDVEFVISKKATVKERTLTKRAATRKALYDDAKEEEQFSSGEDEMFENEAVKEPSFRQDKIETSDSEEDKPPPPRLETSDDMFDSLLRSTQNESAESATNEASKRKKENSDSDSEMFSAGSETKQSQPKKKKLYTDPVKAANAKKPRGRKKKSDDESVPTTKKTTKAKKKIADSSDDEVMISTSPPPSPKPGRVGRGKQKTYVFSSDDSD